MNYPQCLKYKIPFQLHFNRHNVINHLTNLIVNMDYNNKLSIIEIFDYLSVNLKIFDPYLKIHFKEMLNYTKIN